MGAGTVKRPYPGEKKTAFKSETKREDALPLFLPNPLAVPRCCTSLTTNATASAAAVVSW